MSFHSKYFLKGDFVLSYKFLLDIALILISTKLLGLVTKRFQMPQVVGALMAGLLLGPSMLNILQETEFLTMMAELGVIVILFTAGMSTDIKELKKTGKSGFVVAILGVLVPLVLGTLLAFFFNRGEFAHPGNVLLQNIFIGVILTATSVSITVETLKELGKLSTKVGNTILAAALIDDILGLVALTIVTSMADESVKIGMVLLKILLFFIFIGIASFFALRFFSYYCKRVKGKDLHRFPIIAFVLCLVFSYVAEHFFGVANIIGAFAAGLVIACTPKGTYIESKFLPLSYLLLTPIFFASIGIKVQLPHMTWAIVIFAILLIMVAVVSKLIGCGIGAKFCGFNLKQSAQIGIGMACRGEVALIVANKGQAVGLMPPAFMGPVILMVILTSVLTPIFLKVAFRSKLDTHHHEELEESSLIDRYEEPDQLDQVEDALIEANHELQKHSSQSQH